MDGDGQEEIINVRTGDGNTVPFYEGWSIQIVKYSNGLFQDVTNLYVSDADNSETEGPAVIFINMEEIDGEIFLCGRIKANAERLYLLKNGKLSRVPLSKNKYPKVTSGLLISAETRTMQSGWEKYDAFVFGFQNGVDLSYLVEGEYVLEFYLKNTDPGFTFDIHFDTDARNAENDNIVYGTSVNMSSLRHDGSWERIRIPLKDIDLWADTRDSHWNQVFQFVIITTSTGGQEFSVKDIRIRKILPDLV